MTPYYNYLDHGCDPEDHEDRVYCPTCDEEMEERGPALYLCVGCQREWTGDELTAARLEIAKPDD